MQALIIGATTCLYCIHILYYISVCYEGVLLKQWHLAQDSLKMIKPFFCVLNPFFLSSFLTLNCPSGNAGFLNGFTTDILLQKLAARQL